MSVMVAELYEALRTVGVEEDLARAAARAVLSADARTDLATKADLVEFRAAMKADLAATSADVAQLRIATKADLADLKADLIKWNVGALIALTALFSAIVKLAP